MKFIHYLSVTIAVAAVSLFYSCNDTLEVENTPPGQVTNVTFTPLYGGGYFTYTIPDDEDFLYTRAEYIIDTGKKISKTSSVYSDTLFIEGFGQEKEYEVKIYSVDRNSNESQPVIQRVTPLAPTTSAVLETVQVQPGFSSLVLDWTNVLRQNITIYVEVEVGDTKATKIYASNLAKDRYIIENLKGVPHTVNVHIRDTYENRTETRSFGQMTPLIDGPISKRQWSFLRNNLLYGDKWDYNSSSNPFEQRPLEAYLGTWRDDSMKNARETYYEGRIEKFWDNEYDYEPKLNLNYFHTGPQSYPFSYFIDMGREIKGSRFKIWQRNAWGMLYGGENVEIWEIWISDDKDPSDGVFDGWELVGRYRISQPSNVIEARNEARNGHEYMFYPENPRFTKPFRYLRYKGIKQYGNGNSGCTSEITVFGTEADGTIIDDPATLTGVKEGWE
ncbi:MULTISPECIES: DUF4959 domain-containing protein [Petrimonas]|jgi:hypothetical protein|uniref:DUF4959 domain-containing protein n=1 Tax=Petrimonas TaxID=307628 RepID=UPI001775CCE4|nr:MULTISPECIES: DUF4959 domain-containing protein [Petrimonas]MDD3561896.1 DUF4959 domain-containing protein [Petrimonas mucosa]HHT29470.1 DUF4959 domain-containing protein [Petrimonas mucosa]